MAKVKKMGIGGYLGIIPNMLEKNDRNSGFALGVLPGLIHRNRHEKDEAKEAETAATQQAKQAGMKKGGVVKSRGDGCAQRGKTKGKMR